MENEPWSIEVLRSMTREQYWKRVRAGDLPPVDLAAQLLRERLEKALAQHRP